MDFEFDKIAGLAAEAGWDLLTLSPYGDKTLLTCVRRAPGSDLENARVEFDVLFDQVEFAALKGFEAAGWDVRFSAVGVRAYRSLKPQSHERPEPVFRNLPPVPPPPDRSREFRRVA